MVPTAMLGVTVVVILLFIFSRRSRRRASYRSSPLDAVLLRWPSGDPFTIRDLLNGGVAILGRVGSGKTSSSGRLLGTQIVRNEKSGGLILVAKPEDLAMWKAIFHAAGRDSELWIFSPHARLRFNVLDFVLKEDGQTRSITDCIRIIGECLGSHEAKGSSGQDPFWEQQQDRMLYYAVEIVKLATGSISAPTLQPFINGAAQTPEELEKPQWQQGQHCQLLRAAHEAAATDLQKHDCAQAVDYWLGEYPRMADRTRSSILAGVMGLLAVFNTGLVKELLSGETNVSPKDMFEGKWIIVDMSPSAWGSSGKLVCSAWKYATQWSVLRRKATADDAFNVIWVDEAQQLVTSYDAHYIAQCRSHLGCLVFLSQSLPGYYANFGGEAREHRAQALLANFTHTILHAVDPVTAEWAAKKLGQRRETMFGGSSGPGGDVFDDLFGQPKLTGSFSEQYAPVLQENVLINGLRTGGIANDLACDAIVIRSGEAFSNGENWLRCTFLQE
jgi:hypothetical protein